MEDCVFDVLPRPCLVGIVKFLDAKNIVNLATCSSAVRHDFIPKYRNVQLQITLRQKEEHASHLFHLVYSHGYPKEILQRHMLLCGDCKELENSLESPGRPQTCDDSGEDVDEEEILSQSRSSTSSTTYSSSSLSATSQVHGTNFVKSTRTHNVYYDIECYAYRMRNAQEDSQYIGFQIIALRCRTRGCLGTAWLSIDGEVVAKTETEHNHEPAQGDKEKRIVNHEMNQAAKFGHVSARDIRQLVSTLPEDVRLEFPTVRSIARRLASVRGSTGCTQWPFQGWEANAQGLVIYENIAHTTLCSENSLAIITSSKALERLAKCKRWCIDGTFRVRPPLFRQILIIGGELNRQFVPGILVAMGSKKKSAYTDVLRWIIPQLVSVPQQHFVSC